MAVVAEGLGGMGMLGMTRRRAQASALTEPPHWGEVHFDPSLHTAGELADPRGGEAESAPSLETTR